MGVFFFFSSAVIYVESLSAELFASGIYSLRRSMGTYNGF